MMLYGVVGKEQDTWAPGPVPRSQSAGRVELNGLSGCGIGDFTEFQLELKLLDNHLVQKLTFCN